MSTDQLTVSQATVKVLEQLGLPSDTDPHEDHVAKGNSAVHAVARQIAGKLQQVEAPGVKPGERWSKLKDADTELGSIAVDPTSAGSLNMPTNLSAVANGQLFAYKMRSARGKTINATAMLFVPKTTMPTEGWPLVVFGHGTTGVASQCAPSVTMNATGQWSYEGLVALLVAQGMVVVAPDYEGLGSTTLGVPATTVTTGHPYLDLRSAGQSMVLAAVGAKKVLTTQAGSKLSGAWASLGHSQGGHAALAAAQFSGLANQLEPTLNYKGTVAVAPASNLLDSFNTLWASVTSADSSTYASAYNAVGTSNLYAAYLIKGTQSTQRPVVASDLLGANALALYNGYVSSTCLDDFYKYLSLDIAAYSITNGAQPKNYAGVINAKVNEPKVKEMLASNEPGQVKLPGKTLLVQGTADTTVLPAMTTLLSTTMKSKGSDVTLKAYDSTTATHSGVLTNTTAPYDIRDYLKSLFSVSASQAN